MKNKQDLEKQAEQTLNSLDNLQQVEANAFLDAKVLHRMQVMHQPPAINAQKLMMRLVAVLCLFICLNVASYVILKQRNSNTITTKNTNGVDAFADAYGLNNNSNSY